jgi:cell division protein FtsL
MVTDFKKNKKSHLVHPVFLHAGGVAIILLTIGLVVANLRLYHIKQELTMQLAQLNNQVTDLKSQNTNLSQGIENANAGNSQYIEKVAREELDLQQPGEKTVSFIMPETPEQKNGTVQKNHWQAWLGNAWSWLKNRL